jgi:hypothetical protein
VCWMRGERLVNSREIAVHDDVVELWWGSSKGEESDIYVRRLPADLSIATKLITRCPSARCRTAWTTPLLSLCTPLFEPEYAAMSRCNACRAN